MSNQMNITVRADWGEMDRLNTQVMAFFDGTSLPESVAHAYTMMVCELMENGIKYGRQDEVIEVAVSIEDGSITIQVSNKVDGNARGNLRQMDQMLQRTRGVQDPYQAYLDRVREVSRQPLSVAESGLGLVRMAYEGGADIDFILHEDDTLNVSAMARLQ